MLGLYYLFGFFPLHQRGVTACSPGWFPKPLRKSHAKSAVRTLPLMTHNFGKPVALAGLLDQRYTVRYPFSVTAEILELETGTRLGGVTSDLSLRGCFVRATSILEVRARVRLTLARKKQKVEIFAAIRRAAQTGMGLEFLDIDPVSNAILLSWIESLGKAG
jgi:PilZ domain-containing protein